MLDRRVVTAGLGSLMVASAISKAAGAPSTTLAIDHVAMGVRNLFEGSARISHEIGLPSHEGGWFPTGGMAYRYFRTGDDTVLEVNAITDPYLAETNPHLGQMLARFRDGDCFIGWAVRVRTRQELEAIARRLGAAVSEIAATRNVDGSAAPAYVHVPDTAATWARGLPNFTYWDGTPKPILPGPVAPAGFAWLELGGSAEEMGKWIGDGMAALPLRFNGKAPGIHAVGIRSNKGIIELRRHPMQI